MWWLKASFGFWVLGFELICELRNCDLEFVLDFGFCGFGSLFARGFSASILGKSCNSPQNQRFYKTRCNTMGVSPPLRFTQPRQDDNFYLQAFATNGTCEM
jgi:hypothetical protein